MKTRKIKLAVVLICEHTCLQVLHCYFVSCSPKTMEQANDVDVLLMNTWCRRRNMHLACCRSQLFYTQEERQNISVYEKANEAVVNITTETVGFNWFLDPIPMEGGLDRVR